MSSRWERYSRQMLFAPIGEAGQRQLSGKCVCVIGVGALGSVIANHLVRAGVGHVRIADRDYVEESNLQRQMLFDEEDVKLTLPKAVAAERKLRKINSDVQVEGIVVDVTKETVGSLIEDVDLVVDGTDNFSTRFLLNDACFQKEIPFVYGGAVASRGMTAMFVPGETPCLRCMIPESGGNGQTCDTVGVLSPVVDVAASFQATETLKYLIGAKDHRRNTLLTFDLWENRFYEMAFSKPKADCPTCQQKIFPSLNESGNEVTSLCGRETVQIHLQQAFELDEWAGRLSPAAKVTKTPFLLRVELSEGERLVLFPDGRTLVQGTEDLTRAKSLYARYIGM
ncbi:MAG TPA: ThiF family adenylyltransferase [Bacillales bacterium]|nr:ThiF family adenylyltransferase [Bacillales bacterium]